MKKHFIVLLPILFLINTISFTQNSNYKVQKKGNKLGLVNKITKEVIIPFEYDEIIQKSNHTLIVKILIKEEHTTFTPCNSSKLKFYVDGKINMKNQWLEKDKILVIQNPKYKKKYSLNVSAVQYANITANQRQINDNRIKGKNLDVKKCIMQRNKYLNKIKRQYSSVDWKIETIN
jgi:hypothetical protein